MDHDKLVEEVQRLQNWLSDHDPSDEKYEVILGRLIKLTKLGIEFDEACDKQLERQDKLEIETNKSSKEIELRERELNLKEQELKLKNRLDSLRAEETANEMLARRKAEKRQAVWDLIKIALSTACSASLIVMTGKVEQQAILGQHQWSLIPKVK